MQRSGWCLRLSVVASLALASAGACKRVAEPGEAGEGGEAREGGGGSPGAIAPDDRKIHVVGSPETGAVDSIVRESLASVAREKRTLVVYVGATWCEPCQRFHQAAARGELDGEFPRMTLLEFDLDRDRDRLAAAGYVSKYIPLFALPGPDGRASGKQIEGAIKGEGALGVIVPRLKEMLSE
jgi:hypothetical protein